MLLHLLGVMSLIVGVVVTSKPSKPNIILILTDDQDVHMQSMDYMPLLKKYMDLDSRTINLNIGSISLGNTYKGIRLQSKDYGFYYSVHCTNEHELYQMGADPYQINNLLPSGPNGTGIAITDYNSTAKVYNRPLINFVSRLDSLMMVVKSCKGKTCQNPWSILHSKGDVRSLEDALDKKYDDFYFESARSNSVRFSMCANGYIVAAEGPQNPLVYQAADWSAMT